MANVAKLLYSQDQECLLDNISLDVSEKTALREARKKVRAHLRQDFAERSVAELGAKIAPRFFTQGSFAYKTINNPAWVPPQQKDMDDGCYLPMTFIKASQPQKAAAAFFLFVDASLQRLAEAESWQLEAKPTCSRLIIAPDAHIDIPLYAIPDDQFQTLKAEEYRADSMRSAGRAMDTARVLRWSDLPSDSVLLAHREEDWIASDPRKIHNWFMEAVNIYGERLQRVSRYLKAWRDHHRPDLDRVSSILLMACAFEAFESEGKANLPSRDDQVLLVVLKALPDLLNGEVANPAERTERLDARLGDEDRRIAVAKAEEFRREVEQIVEVCADADVAVDRLKAMLGERVPDRPDLVGVADEVVARVRSVPPRIVPAPVVGRSNSA